MTNKLPKSLFLPLYFYLKTFYLLSITIFRRFFDCLEQKKKRLERINSKDEQCAYSAEEISSLVSPMFSKFYLVILIKIPSS